MAESSTYKLRSKVTTELQAVKEPTLRDLHQLLLSVCNRLDAIEGDLVCRVVDVEKSLEVAHWKTGNLEKHCNKVADTHSNNRAEL